MRKIRARYRILPSGDLEIQVWESDRLFSKRLRIQRGDLKPGISRLDLMSQRVRRAVGTNFIEIEFEKETG